MPMSPGLLMALVRGAFRLGQNFRDMSEENALMADQIFTRLPIGAVSIEDSAIGFFLDRPELATKYPGVFDTSGGGGRLKSASQIDQGQLSRAIQEAMDALAMPADMPAWANGKISSVIAVRGLRTREARRDQYARFGFTLVETGLEVVALQPSLVSFNNARAETLIGAFASKVRTIIGPGGIHTGEVDGHSFKERAAAALLRASLTTIAENPSTIVSESHWAEFVGAVLSPLAAAQDAAGADIIALNRLPELMRGPMAQAALRTLYERQDDFFGRRLQTDRVAGVITNEILAAAVRRPADQFDILDVFSQSGLTMVYTASLNAAATRPELFVRGDGEAARSFRMLLGNVAGVLRDAPPPFDADSGLADKLTCAVIDVAAEHMTRRVMADFSNEEGPWNVVTGQILTSILTGFREGLPNALAADENPFRAVFNQDQAIDIVRLIAAQAAQTPEMLLGAGHRNEVYGIARAIAVFMSNPDTSLASGADWRAVIAVALEEAAKNPGTLFDIDPAADPESHLAVTLIGALLTNARSAVLTPAGGGTATARRTGSVLFGSTLRQAIEMTLRAAANNARALLDEATNINAFNRFVASLQQYTASKRGGVGADEWLWLYRSFVAEVIANGTEIPPERFDDMVRRMPGMIAPPITVVADDPEIIEEGPTS